MVVGVVVAVALVGLGFALWANDAMGPGSDAEAVLDGSGGAAVGAGGDLTLIPESSSPTVGLIFYPGARVAPTAYAGLAQSIADAGYLVVVPHVTLNMAIFDTSVGDRVIADHPEIETWFVGGHSLGGTSAAMYLDAHRQEIAGIVFWGSYPGGGTDLSDYDGVVTSIFGSEDGLSTPAKVEAAAPLLPQSTEYVEIVGGNHAQFGDYGSQGGDGVATISLAEQHAEVVAATLAALGRAE